MKTYNYIYLEIVAKSDEVDFAATNPRAGYTISAKGALTNRKENKYL